MSNPYDDLASCVVLASGFSRRFNAENGDDKLAHTLASGATVLQQTLTVYTDVFSQVYVVLRPEQIDAYHPLIRRLDTVVPIPNTAADMGMSQSVIKAVMQVPPRAGWLFALADMPYLKPDTVRRIVHAATPNNIVQPRCFDKPGNPVFIGRDFAKQLLELNGDTGARELIKGLAADRLRRLVVDDPGVTQDIDYLNNII